jgi:hypothetical protein
MTRTGSRSRWLALFTVVVSACGSSPGISNAPLPTATGMATATASVLPSPAATTTPLPTPVPTPEPTTKSGLPRLRDGSVAAGSYEVVPPEFWDACWDEDPDCVEAPGSTSITVTWTVPPGWEAIFGGTTLVREGREDPAPFMGIHAGGFLHVDPCLKVSHAEPEIPVDPTSADSFVDALVAHPLLDVNEPKAISLGGFEGQYVEVRAPADISSCAAYRPWEPGLYAQAPLELRRNWAIDVAGTRLVVGVTEYPSTSAADRAEMESIVNSIRFLP